MEQSGWTAVTRLSAAAQCRSLMACSNKIMAYIQQSICLFPPHNITHCNTTAWLKSPLLCCLVRSCNVSNVYMVCVWDYCERYSWSWEEFISQRDFYSSVCSWAATHTSLHMCYHRGQGCKRLQFSARRGQWTELFQPHLLLLFKKVAKLKCDY